MNHHISFKQNLADVDRVVASYVVVLDALVFGVVLFIQLSEEVLDGVVFFVKRLDILHSILGVTECHLLVILV